ncbi:unnamed protein product [Rotaria magnacalcarata]|uniref:Uncharacterized protein n=1 Tax=Rotaria magnacalcarata TaxID=392030 RepID=A0A815D294_9BILA|nr:unnamed protein product [Rotaria magnacalcarata]CAF4111223.1 unnamed protein product [Rotaria magnacalcarata]
MIDDLFVAHFRSIGLILSQAEIFDTDQQIVLRLHLLALRKTKTNTSIFTPCHVEIFIPHAIQVQMKNLALMVDVLNENLSAISDDETVQSNKILEEIEKYLKQLMFDLSSYQLH